MTDQLRSIFARWQNLEEAKAATSEDLKELFAEAKGNGFEPKALRAAFRQMVKDEEAESDPEKAELQAMIDLYVDALKFGAVVEPSRVSAPARVEIIEETATNTSGESRERQTAEPRPAAMPAPLRSVSKPEAPPADEAAPMLPTGTAATNDEDIPTFLQRGHSDNAWAVSHVGENGR